jgi:hypothetical protein
VKTSPTNKVLKKMKKEGGEGVKNGMGRKE